VPRAPRRLPAQQLPIPAGALIDPDGLEHAKVLFAGNDFRPVHHFGNIPVRRTIGGIPEGWASVVRAFERDGPFGGPATGPGGQPLGRRQPGANPFG